MAQYYEKFIKEYSTLTNPLNILLRKGSVWKWGLEQKAAFVELKKQLASAPLLVHFSNTLLLRLACDASAYGVGAVISHLMSDGSEQPKTKCNYNQIEKEALGIVFGVKKFHQYLSGRLFTLITDHKPLTSIFGPPLLDVIYSMVMKW